jgi:hypothetical protein
MPSALEFAQLCRDAGRVLGLADADRFAETGELTVGGVSMALFRETDDEELPDEATVDCYVDLGPIDSVDREAALEKLLEMNLSIPRKREGVVGFDSDSRRAILCLEIEEDSLDSDDDLADYLSDIADFVQELRQRFEMSGDASMHSVSYNFQLA